MAFQLRATYDGLTIGAFPHLEVAHGVATRVGGLSEAPYASLNLGPRSGDDTARVSANLARFLGALGMTGMTLIAPRQVHGAVVSVHRRESAPPPDGVYEGDGILTDDPDVVVMVLAADCAVILLHDLRQGVVGALHAGWRGTALGIARAGIEQMQTAFKSDPLDIRAGIGPAIGHCCYEVGIDVAEAVAGATPGTVPFDLWEGGKAMLDIAAANVAQLDDCGLLPAHVAAAEICTACRTDLFFSHRREGEPTGRFGVAISLGRPNPRPHPS